MNAMVARMTIGTTMAAMYFFGYVFWLSMGGSSVAVLSTALVVSLG